jgi:hypothetical protein
MSTKISARRGDGNVIVSKGPDVCLTPKGSSMVPVAYSSVAHLENSIRTSTSVLNNGNQDFQLNSRVATSTGHEPGTGRGVVKPGYLGPAHVVETTSNVFSEGFASCRHEDPAFINMPSPGGTAPKAGKCISEI